MPPHFLSLPPLRDSIACRSPGSQNPLAQPVKRRLPVCTVPRPEPPVSAQGVNLNLHSARLRRRIVCSRRCCWRRPGQRCLFSGPSRALSAATAILSASHSAMTPIWACSRRAAGTSWHRATPPTEKGLSRHIECFFLAPFCSCFFLVRSLLKPHFRYLHSLFASLFTLSLF